jgi:hypothetical protein
VKECVHGLTAAMIIMKPERMSAKGTERSIRIFYAILLVKVMMLLVYRTTNRNASSANF